MTANDTGSATNGAAPAGSPGAAAPVEGMPLFYSAPQAVTPERHGGHSLAREPNYAFARATNSVPINAIEFAHAQRNFPIVFTPGEPAVPVAVLGLRDKQNEFVGAAGKWEAGAYIPAYIRRYPFVFSTAADQQSYILCVDEASPALVRGADNPLFTDGKPTPVLNNALSFCSSFQQEYDKTLQFGAALIEHRLLETKTADVTLQGGQKLVFGAFRVVNEAAFIALPDTVVTDWHKRGWLALVVAHLLSFANWAHLTAKAAQPQLAKDGRS